MEELGPPWRKKINALLAADAALAGEEERRLLGKVGRVLEAHPEMEPTLSVRALIDRRTAAYEPKRPRHPTKHAEGLCGKCSWRAKSRAAVARAAAAAEARGARPGPDGVLRLGLVSDTAPRAECKQHEGYGDTVGKMTHCSDFRPAEYGDPDDDLPPEAADRIAGVRPSFEQVETAAAAREAKAREVSAAYAAEEGPDQAAVLQGMADHLWALAWDRHVAARQCHDPAGSTPPPTPPGAKVAANAVAQAIEQGNDRTLGRLFRYAMWADGGMERSDPPERFGMCLIHEALGFGALWFEDHEGWRVTDPAKVVFPPETGDGDEDNPFGLYVPELDPVRFVDPLVELARMDCPRCSPRT